GFGPRLGAAFLAALGGDIALYDSADRLAGVAGLAPVPRDSGRVSGNLHRPRRFNRRLLARPIWPPNSASATTQRPSTTTIANAPRANATPKPSSPWHAGETTCM